MVFRLSFESSEKHFDDKFFPPNPILVVMVVILYPE